MTTKALEKAIERAQSWPDERQDDAARMLLEMEAQMTSPYRLTDEQLAEIRRRRAVKNPEAISLAELDSRLRRRGV
jgi:hypothetical protein